MHEPARCVRPNCLHRLLFAVAGNFGEDQTLTRVVTGLPPHSMVRLQATIFTIDRWEAGDVVSVVVDGAAVAVVGKTTAPYTTLPSSGACGLPDNPRNQPVGYGSDTVHNVLVDVVHSGASVSVSFVSSVSGSVLTGAVGVEWVRVQTGTGACVSSTPSATGSVSWSPSSSGSVSESGSRSESSSASGSTSESATPSASGPSC